MGIDALAGDCSAGLPHLNPGEHLIGIAASAARLSAILSMLALAFSGVCPAEFCRGSLCSVFVCEGFVR